MKKNIYILLWSILLTACVKDRQIPAGLTSKLELTTSPVTAITQTSAASGVQIAAIYSQDVLNKGICWNVRGNPTLNDLLLSGGKGAGIASINLSNLTPGTTYYVRSFAVTPNETVYGDQQRFVTQSYQPATLSTLAVTSITMNGAISGGQVTSSGGGTITARGICWSTISLPTIAGSRTTDGSGTGSYSSTLSGLSPGTLYYVRAYATNQAGTAYGGQVSFVTTAIQLATVSSVSVTSVSKNSAFVTGSAVTDGGGTITSRGICWSTGSNPTLATASAVSNGTGTGTISANLSGLLSGTTYYVRTYATNQAGTAYGTVTSFRTL